MSTSFVRQSVYTILVLILGAAAIGCMFIPHAAAPAISLVFASLGVLVGGSAFSSREWRRDAGAVRHTIVFLVTIGCAIVGVKDVLALVQ